MKSGSTLKQHAGIKLDICSKSSGESDLELDGGAVPVEGALKVNGKSVVMGVGKSDVFSYIQDLD